MDRGGGDIPHAHSICNDPRRQDISVQMNSGLGDGVKFSALYFKLPNTLITERVFYGDVCMCIRVSRTFVAFDLGIAGLLGLE